MRGREDSENIRNRAGFVFVLSVCRYWGFWEGGSKGKTDKLTLNIAGPFLSLGFGSLCGF